MLAEGYPSQEKIYNQSYIHSRSLEYKALGVDVDVLSFSSARDYDYEGVKVFSLASLPNLAGYDVVVSHAPNIRNHYRFIVKRGASIKRLVMVFHGHEILKWNKYYPGGYAWEEKKSASKRFLRSVYDEIKLFLIKRMLKKRPVRAVFVSEWMKDEGYRCLGISSLPPHRIRVINNPINIAFSRSSYSFDEKSKKADFITIRPLSGKKYAVDMVVELARVNPQYTFHIYGEGGFFRHNEKPDNVEVFDAFVEQKDIPLLLNKYRAAVMPTRLDAQGVMMCEMASYGIPVIVSDLPVCREMLGEFGNVFFINNESFNNALINIDKLIPLQDRSVIKKFHPNVLAKKELDFFFQEN